MKRTDSSKTASRVAATLGAALLMLTACFFASGWLGYEPSGAVVHTAGVPKGARTASDEYGWNLMLVNGESYIPQGYEIKLTRLENGERLDKRICPCLQEMFAAAREEGIYLEVTSGYRSSREQGEIMEQRKEKYESMGYAGDEAVAMAASWVMEPGTSEHQLGLAADINSAFGDSGEAYDWLAENAHEYGFILRYPEDKTEVTGIDYEPWHYRYVGREAAKEIYEQGLCLEEYVEALEARPPAG